MTSTNWRYWATHSNKLTSMILGLRVSERPADRLSNYHFFKDDSIPWASIPAWSSIHLRAPSIVEAWNFVRRHLFGYYIDFLLLRNRRLRQRHHEYTPLDTYLRNYSSKMNFSITPTPKPCYTRGSQVHRIFGQKLCAHFQDSVIYVSSPSHAIKRRVGLWSWCSWAFLCGGFTVGFLLYVNMELMLHSQGLFPNSLCTRRQYRFINAPRLSQLFVIRTERVITLVFLQIMGFRNDISSFATITRLGLI